MMKSKLYSKNPANCGLFLNLHLLFIALLLFGCSPPKQIEPTYKEKDIPHHVKKICKEEYGLDVKTIRSGNTLWIYAPLERIIHKDFATNKDKILDEEMSNKLRNLLTTVGRVLISADDVPQFYGLIASDINEVGVDYILIGNVLDIKKSYAHFIPWTETNRRYVIKLQLNPQALGDTQGEHIEPFDIDLKDFLAAQIAQRISGKFQNQQLKGHFNVERIESLFDDRTLTLKYAIRQIKSLEEQIDVQKEIIDIISYVMQTYEFEDFQRVEINDLLTQEKVILSKAALKNS